MINIAFNIKSKCLAFLEIVTVTVLAEGCSQKLLC